LEAKIRRLVEANVVGIVMWNLEGAITEANEAFFRMVQYDRDDIASGRVRWTDLTPAEWRDRDERALADLKATGIFQTFEKEYFRKDGSRVPVLLGGAFFEGGGNDGVAFVLDLSEQKRAERALRRSEAFLTQGQHLSQIGSFSWRVATDEITWSEQLYRIYELEIGVPVTLELIRTRVHPEDVSLIEKMKAVHQASDGGTDFEWQYRLMMPDHSIKYMHAVAHATRDQVGRLEYIAVVQDVTARRLAEEARDKARSELAHVARVMSLGTLTASIAHELNQPLSGIVTNASTCMRMLATDPPNVDGARETARRTIRDGNRASEVVNRLRALFSKKDAATESVDLNEATREVIALSSSELQRKRVVLQSELADDLPTITGDRIQLQQVILNLLRNASDAMSGVEDRPRQLTIRTERDEGDRMRLSVQDAGTGFEPESMHRLFEAFYTTKSEGMGMGLLISRSIIESHYGRLWATLNNGPGATFSFSLPCEAAKVTDAASSDVNNVTNRKRAARSD
jgi:PAS domain S-box-containing protein